MKRERDAMKITSVEVLIAVAVIVFIGLVGYDTWHDTNIERPIRYEVWCRMRGGDAPAVSYEEWIIAVDKPKQAMVNAHATMTVMRYGEVGK
jgi:hypothetical protein